ncbi:hypothetical protein BG000_006594, partial [Podila horticola]
SVPTVHRARQLERHVTITTTTSAAVKSTTGVITIDGGAAHLEGTGRPDRDPVCRRGPAGGKDDGRSRYPQGAGELQRVLWVIPLRAADECLDRGMER